MCSAMNHDENRYEKPKQFIPERWTRSEHPVKMSDQFAFPIFSGGPRVCLGKDLALYEAKILLAEVVKRYRFEFADEVYRNETRKEGWTKDVLWVNGDPVYDQGLVLFFRENLELRMFSR